MRLIHLVLKFLFIITVPISTVEAAFADGSKMKFMHAAELGVVDFFVGGTEDENLDAYLNLIKELKPGIINRVGFEFGGLSLAKISRLKQVIPLIINASSQSIIGGGFPESVYNKYNIVLACNDKASQRYTAAQLGTDMDGSSRVWIDLSLPAAIEYYKCIGKIQIDLGITFFHFEQSDRLLGKQDIDKVATFYRDVIQTLENYGKQRGTKIYFSGDSKLAKLGVVTAIYRPARLYIEDFDTQYRNKIVTKTGVGYYYSLSKAIVKDYVSKLSNDISVLFYIDNFDPTQDDLRRMMELDKANRQKLIYSSSQTAIEAGAFFVHNINHCAGCVPVSAVHDQCEIREDSRSQYDAVKCGDSDLLVAIFKSYRSRLK